METRIWLQMSLIRLPFYRSEYSSRIILCLSILLLLCSCNDAITSTEKNTENYSANGRFVITSRLNGFVASVSYADNYHTAILNVINIVHSGHDFSVICNEDVFLAKSIPKVVVGKSFYIMLSPGLRNIDIAESVPCTAMQIVDERIVTLGYSVECRYSSRNKQVILDDYTYLPVEQDDSIDLIKCSIVQTDKECFQIHSEDDLRLYRYILLPTAFYRIIDSTGSEPAFKGEIEAYYIISLGVQ